MKKTAFINLALFGSLAGLSPVDSAHADVPPDDPSEVKVCVLASDGAGVSVFAIDEEIAQILVLASPSRFSLVSTETCDDSIDNDCDGLVDESCDGEGSAAAAFEGEDLEAADECDEDSDQEGCASPCAEEHLEGSDTCGDDQALEPSDDEPE